MSADHLHKHFQKYSNINMEVQRTYKAQTLFEKNKTTTKKNRKQLGAVAYAC